MNELQYHEGSPTDGRLADGGDNIGGGGRKLNASNPKVCKGQRASNRTGPQPSTHKKRRTTSMGSMVHYPVEAAEADEEIYEEFM